MPGMRRRALLGTRSLMRCYITDRHPLGGVEPLLDAIAKNLAAGVERIQIREKDLAARDLFQLVRRALALPNPHGSQILVNSRVDIALAAGANGAHLPAGSIAAAEWRRITPARFLVGVSCHTLAELREARRQGADFAFYGPVFQPLSKAAFGPPLGLSGLAAGCRAAGLPVFALGGITEQNAAACREAGAAGVAGITLFQKPANLPLTR